MKTTIQNKLREIEQSNGVKMLFACESGSRGWEFSSPDSDYDVRFIYIKTINEYLSVTEKEDQLSFPINDELDIYGWDLRKVLQLIRKSNTTPFEWLQSPIVYFEEGGFRDALWALCQQYYSQRSNAHHYLGIAKGALDTMDKNGMIKIKKLFYVLRPLLAAKWCLEKNTIAPMSIEPLMGLLPADLKQKLQLLITQKEEAAEGFLMRPDSELLEWIKATEDYCIEASKDLPRNQFPSEGLDFFFRKILTKYDYTRY